jgi:hypothetical protein
LQSSAETTSPGLRGARKLSQDLSSFFSQNSGSGPIFPTFTFEGINTGPTKSVTTNLNSGFFEGAGGTGGGASSGQGSLTFDLDNVSNLESTNSGSTISNGGSFAFVGFDPEQSSTFFTNTFGANALFGFGGNGSSGGSSSGGGTR